MNWTQTHTPQLVVFGRIAALVVAAVAVVFAASLFASWLAPIAVVPLLVAGWVVGLGFAIFLPFAIVAGVAWVIAR